MMYINTTKKYSHCQCSSVSALSHHGFFLIEFVYAFLIVTSFMMIVSLFIAMSIHWQQVTSNRLLALMLARNQIEALMLNHTQELPPKSTYHEDIFIMETSHEKKQIGAIEVRHSWVTVTWDDGRGQTQRVMLETFA